MIVGVTGLYCAGKNTFCSLLKEQWPDEDIQELDVDSYGHIALVESADSVIKHFGSSILNKDSSINRKQLGKIVFSDPRELKVLESIVHPVMVTKIREDLKKSRHTILNAALLFKMGLADLCNHRIIVEAPFLSRLGRAMKRDKLSLLETVKRFEAQNELFAQINKKYADIIKVQNNGDLYDLTKRIHTLLHQLKE